jgi:hypothetical protein
MSTLEQKHTQRFDEGGLTDAGHPGDTETQRLAAMRQQSVEQGISTAAMFGTSRLEQRDGFGQSAPIADAHSIDQALVFFRQCHRHA